MDMRDFRGYELKDSVTDLLWWGDSKSKKGV